MGLKMRQTDKAIQPTEYEAPEKGLNPSLGIFDICLGSKASHQAVPEYLRNDVVPKEACERSTVHVTSVISFIH